MRSTVDIFLTHDGEPIMALRRNDERQWITLADERRDVRVVIHGTAEELVSFAASLAQVAAAIEPIEVVA